jgi:hypothetical protein
MKAKLKISYHEQVAQGDNDADGYYHITDKVSVTLRRWTAGQQCDFILDTYLIVNGKTMKDGKILYFGLSQESQAIRQAIAIFDELLARHPVLKLERKEETDE